MQLAFSPDKKVEVSFKVGIAGTSSTPKTVMVVLERDNLSLSFSAIKEGDEYKAVVQDVGVFSEGSVNLSVNVLLNGRVFTPLKTAAMITSTLAQSEKVEVKVESFTPKLEKATPVVEKKQVKEIQIPKPAVKAVEKVVEKVKIESPVRMSLLQSVEPKKPVTRVTAKQPEPVTKVTESTTHFRLKRVKTIMQ